MKEEKIEGCNCICCYDDGKSNKSLDMLFLRLEERIRTVRTARIYASKRFKRDHLFYQRITIIFSIISTLLAIFFISVDADAFKKVIGTPRYASLNQWLLVLATYVTLITLYASIRNPGEKIGIFKSNYMELTELLHEVQLFNKKTSNQEATCNCEKYIQTESQYKRLSKMYAALLTQTENHDDIDYSYSIVYLESSCCTQSERNEKLKKARKTIKIFHTLDFLKKLAFSLSLPLLIIGILLVEYAPIRIFNTTTLCCGLFSLLALGFIAYFYGKSKSLEL